MSRKNEQIVFQSFDNAGCRIPRVHTRTESHHCRSTMRQLVSQVLHTASTLLEVKTHLTAYELNWKCPCCDQGELVFISCPTCNTTVLVCTELNDVWDIKGHTVDDCLGEGLGGYDGDFCHTCKKTPYVEFRDTLPEEIRRLGFTEDQFQSSPGT